jgi:hypothetical protein
MSNYSFNNSFCQKIIIYLESLYNTLYFDIKFISEYWKMNSKSWQDGLFHGTKWRENYQCSRLWLDWRVMSPGSYLNPNNPVVIFHSLYTIMVLYKGRGRIFFVYEHFHLYIYHPRYPLSSSCSVLIRLRLFIRSLH